MNQPGIIPDLDRIEIDQEDLSLGCCKDVVVLEIPEHACAGLVNEVDREAEIQAQLEAAQDVPRG